METKIRPHDCYPLSQQVKDPPEQTPLPKTGMALLRRHQPYFSFPLLPRPKRQRLEEVYFEISVWSG
jgi:hypothetical protein